MGFRQATFYLAKLFHQATFYLAELFRQITSPFILWTIQDPTDDTRKWDAANLKEMHAKFGDWASEINDPCDAEENSYDGMLLLTGASFQKSQIFSHFYFFQQIVFCRSRKWVRLYRWSLWLVIHLSQCLLILNNDMQTDKRAVEFFKMFHCF